MSESSVVTVPARPGESAELLCVSLGRLAWHVFADGRWVCSHCGVAAEPDGPVTPARPRDDLVWSSAGSPAPTGARVQLADGSVATVSVLPGARLALIPSGYSVTGAGLDRPQEWPLSDVTRLNVIVPKGRGR